VNVGGTGKLPMSALIAMCQRLDFSGVRTYIASGNAVFASSLAEKRVKRLLESELERYAGKPVGVLVRTGAELAAVLAKNPFPGASPSRTVAIFLDAAPSAATLRGVTGADSGEEVRLGTREVYVHYPNGIGRSKLKVPGTSAGTARNMNTIRKLAEMAAKGDRS
jgi:uncharacterized protein (DUF1697 family)